MRSNFWPLRASRNKEELLAPGSSRWITSSVAYATNVALSSGTRVADALSNSFSCLEAVMAQISQGEHRQDIRDEFLSQCAQLEESSDDGFSDAADSEIHAADSEVSAANFETHTTGSEIQESPQVLLNINAGASSVPLNSVLLNNDAANTAYQKPLSDGPAGQSEPRSAQYSSLDSVSGSSTPNQQLLSSDNTLNQDVRLREDTSELLIHDEILEERSAESSPQGEIVARNIDPSGDLAAERQRGSPNQLSTARSPSTQKSKALRDNVYQSGDQLADFADPIRNDHGTGAANSFIHSNHFDSHGVPSLQPITGLRIFSRPRSESHLSGKRRIPDLKIRSTSPRTLSSDHAAVISNHSTGRDALEVANLPTSAGEIYDSERLKPPYTLNSVFNNNEIPPAASSEPKQNSADTSISGTSSNVTPAPISPQHLHLYSSNPEFPFASSHSASPTSELDLEIPEPPRPAQHDLPDEVLETRSHQGATSANKIANSTDLPNTKADAQLVRHSRSLESAEDVHQNVHLSQVAAENDAPPQPKIMSPVKRSLATDTDFNPSLSRTHYSLQNLPLEERSPFWEQKDGEKSRSALRQEAAKFAPTVVKDAVAQSRSGAVSFIEKSDRDKHPGLLEAVLMLSSASLKHSLMVFGESQFARKPAYPDHHDDSTPIASKPPHLSASESYLPASFRPPDKSPQLGFGTATAHDDPDDSFAAISTAIRASVANKSSPAIFNPGSTAVPRSLLPHNHKLAQDLNAHLKTAILETPSRKSSFASLPPKEPISVKPKKRTRPMDLKNVKRRAPDSRPAALPHKGDSLSPVVLPTRSGSAVSHDNPENLASATRSIHPLPADVKLDQAAAQSNSVAASPENADEMEKKRPDALALRPAGQVANAVTELDSLSESRNWVSGPVLAPQSTPYRAAPYESLAQKAEGGRYMIPTSSSLAKASPKRPVLEVPQPPAKSRRDFTRNRFLTASLVPLSSNPSSADQVDLTTPQPGHTSRKYYNPLKIFKYLEQTRPKRRYIGDEAGMSELSKLRAITKDHGEDLSLKHENSSTSNFEKPNLLNTPNSKVFAETPKTNRNISGSELLPAPAFRGPFSPATVEHLPEIHTDEELDEKRSILKPWAKSPDLTRLVQNASHCNMDKILANMPRLDFDEVFVSNESRERYMQSPMPRRDRRQRAFDEKKYAVAMGFK